MIKCPNCGSTAQVKIIKKYWSSLHQSENIHCQCGCGCIFHIEKFADGITNGSWQINEKDN